MKEIIFDVMDDGEIKIETKNFNGKSCIEETEAIKNLLGHEISCNLTAAYFSTNKTVIKKHLTLCG